MIIMIISVFYENLVKTAEADCVTKLDRQKKVPWSNNAAKKTFLCHTMTTHHADHFYEDCKFSKIKRMA